MDGNIVERGMAASDRCRFCHEFWDKADPYLCPEYKKDIFAYIKEKGWKVVDNDGNEIKSP